MSKISNHILNIIFAEIEEIKMKNITTITPVVYITDNNKRIIKEIEKNLI